MHWTLSYLLQSGLWVLAWLVGGLGVAAFTVRLRRRGR